MRPVERYDKAAQYITLPTNILDVPQFKRFRKMLGKEGVLDIIAVTLRLSCTDGFRVKYDVVNLADDCDIDEESIESIIQLAVKRNWFVIEDDYLTLTEETIELVLGRLVAKRERTHKRNQKHYEKKKKDKPSKPTKKPKQSVDKGFMVKFNAFIKLFNDITGREFKGDSKAKAHFKARLKEGYTGDQFRKAITNAHNSEYHRENNGIYLTPELITRQDKLEMYLNSKGEKRESMNF